MSSLRVIRWKTEIDFFRAKSEINFLKSKISIDKFYKIISIGKIQTIVLTEEILGNSYYDSSLKSFVIVK